MLGSQLVASRSLGSGDKRLHHFSICGDRAPLLLRRGQRAEGGNKVQVSRLAIGHRAGLGGRRKAVRDRFALQGGTGDFP